MQAGQLKHMDTTLHTFYTDFKGSPMHSSLRLPLKVSKV